MIFKDFFNFEQQTALLVYFLDSWNNITNIDIW